MRGSAFEKLIIEGLAMTAKKEAHLQDSKTKGKQNKNVLDISVKEVVYFKRKTLRKLIKDAITSAAGSKQTLFVPIVQNYGLIDCVVLNHENKSASNGPHALTFYLIQITINVNSHEKGDKEIKADSTAQCKHHICQVDSSYLILTILIC